SALDGDNGWPLLHDADYGAGQFQVLTIPENFADLYHYPEAPLNAIRRTLTDHLPVVLEAPSKVSLFVYDNGTFVVHNFRDESVRATVVLDESAVRLEELGTKATLRLADRRGSAGRDKPSVVIGRYAEVDLPPHSFRAFRRAR
ncbi:MAG: hypothetical protein GX535_02380, partial [Xanthomonadaceae bacterium]|nr:hypothetical protein [Xanthomonadaceae bacterium]